MNPHTGGAPGVEPPRLLEVRQRLLQAPDVEQRGPENGVRRRVVRARDHRPPQLVERPHLVALHEAQVRAVCAGADRTGGIEREGPERRDAAPLLQRPRRNAVRVREHQRAREPRPRPHHRAVARDGGLVERDGLEVGGGVATRAPAHPRLRLQVQVVRDRVAHRDRRRGQPILRRRRQLHGGHDPAGDFGLHGDDVAELRLKGRGRLPAALRPPIRRHLDELRAHHDAALGAAPRDAHGAGEQVADAELLRDLGRRSAAAGVLVGAGARDHHELAHARQPPPDLVGDPVGHVGVGAVPLVLEREHGEPRRRVRHPIRRARGDVAAEPRQRGEDGERHAREQRPPPAPRSRGSSATSPRARRPRRRTRRPRSPCSRSSTRATAPRPT